MSEKPFGVDISGWQGTINWDTIASYQPKVEFAFMKATQAIIYKDQRFKYNWANAKRVRIPRGAYHYMEFDKDLNAQMSNFINAFEGDYGELPPVLDCERDSGKTKGFIKSAILRCAEII